MKVPDVQATKQEILGVPIDALTMENKTTRLSHSVRQSNGVVSALDVCVVQRRIPTALPKTATNR